MKHFMFDLMGVIFHNGHILKHYFCDVWGYDYDIVKPVFVRFEKGEIGEDEFWKGIHSNNRFEELYKSIVKDFDDGLLDIIDIYPDSSYTVITNMPSPWGHKLIDWVESKSGITFSRIISGDTGMLKPSLEMYVLAYNSMDIKPYDEVYYFDDRLRNLKPVEKLGISPVHLFHDGEEHNPGECPYLCIDNLRKFLDNVV